MSVFVPKWEKWEETGRVRTCKTCKSPFAGFAGSQDGCFRENGEPFAGFAGSQDGHSGKPVEVQTCSLPTCKTSKRVPGDPIETMDLSDFARSGLVVRIHSRPLSRDILLVSDTGKVPDPSTLAGGAAIYRATDFRNLAILRQDPRVRSIRDLLTIVQGVITDVRSCT